MGAAVLAVKPFNLWVENRDGYLYAHVSVRPLPHPPVISSREYLEDIAKECVTYRGSKILIEKHTPEPFIVWDVFLLAPKLATSGQVSFKIAVVDKGGEPQTKTTLTVMVGKYCGLDVRVFNDIAEAENWLQAG